MKTKIFFLFSAALLFLPIMAQADTDHLVISQVQITGGTGMTNNDFAEIFNPTNHEIDLSGMILVKRTSSDLKDEVIKVWNSPTLIPAFSFYLVAHPAFTAITRTPDAFFEPDRLLSTNNGLALRIGAADSGTIIDRVAWGSSSPLSFRENTAASTPGANKGITRKFSVNNIIQDTDNNADDFKSINAVPHNLTLGPNPPVEEQSSSPSSPPIVPTEPEVTYSTDIVISEFLPNPDGPDSGKEWVELYNNSQDEVDLEDWVLDGEATTKLLSEGAYTFPSGAKVAGQSFLAFNLPAGSFLLNNTGSDTIRLFWPNKTLLTQATYLGNAKDDETYARKMDGTYAWTNLATKGTANQFPGVADGIVSVAQTRVKINEIFPGGWLELANAGTEPILIHGWSVDSGKPGSAIDQGAYKIQSPRPSSTGEARPSFTGAAILYPGGLAVLVIPAGIFAPDNLSGTVRLFNENGILIDLVTYADAKEGFSYQLIDNLWTWARPTPNAVNILLAEEKVFQPVPQPVSQIAPEKENQIILATAKKPISSSVESTQPVVEPQLPTSPTGVVSGADIVKEVPATENNLPWVWLVLSFAINLAFCYILIRLMLRKGQKYEQTRVD